MKSSSIRFASGRRRFAAHLIDAALLGGLLGIGLAIVILSSPSPELAAYVSGKSDAMPDISIPSWYLFVCLAAAWLYYVPLEVSRLQASIGKAAAGIRLVDLAGRPLTFARANVRFVCKIAVGAVYGAFGLGVAWIAGFVSPVLATVLSVVCLYSGYLFVARSPRKQDVYDKIAGVMLIQRDS